MAKKVTKKVTKKETKKEKIDKSKKLIQALIVLSVTSFMIKN